MVPCPTFPRAGGVFKAPSCYFQLDPSSLSWSIKYGLRRKAEPVLESGGNRRVLEAEGGGTGRLSPSEAAGKQCALWAALPLAEKARSPAERLKSHSRLLPETSGPPQAHHLYASLCIGPPALKKAMIQDGEAEPAGCVIQKRATDSGISETN